MIYRTIPTKGKVFILKFLLSQTICKRIFSEHPGMAMLFLLFIHWKNKTKQTIHTEKTNKTTTYTQVRRNKRIDVHAIYTSHKTKDNLKIMRKQVVNNQYQTIFVVWNQGTASHDDFSTFITRNRKKIIANCALLIYPVHGVRTHNTLDCKLQRLEGSHSCGKQSTIKKKINSTVYRH